MPAPFANLFPEAWRKLPRAARLVLAALLLFAAGWAGIVSFVLPRRAERVRLEGEIRTLAAGTAALPAQVEALRGQARGEGEQQRALAELRRRLEETLTRLPDSRALSAFLRDLTAPAEGEGIAFVSIVPHPFEKRGEILELPFTLELEGGYLNLTRFLARLESLPRLVAVQRVSLQGQSGTSPLLRASVAASTYVLGEAR